MNKILVTYASRTGSTAEIAQAMGKTLREHGADVDVLPVESVKSLAPYDAVVAGSAIQGGAWLPEAVDFLRTHQVELAQKPFAAFLVCMTLAMKQASAKDSVVRWMEPIRRIANPMSEGYFAGVLDLSKIPGRLDRWLFRISVLIGVWTEGDHRDWNAIQNWTENVAAQFTLETV